MNIAIIGYGKMGKEIEIIAKERNHTIKYVLDENNYDQITAENFKDIDVAIEFTTPESAVNNYIKCFEVSVPVVSGTTGWLDRIDEVKQVCINHKQAFFYASNFSFGVNIFFELNKTLARLMSKSNDYQLSIEEIHHTKKKDQPSGTAITLANEIIQINTNKEKWVNSPTNEESELSIISVRQENIPGTHTISYTSSVDAIEIKHTAKNRKGFALGAIIAAEFIKGKTGIFGMNDLLKI